MKNSMSNTGLIDRYLCGKLSLKEKYNFENGLHGNPAFGSEFQLQEKTMRILKLFFRNNKKKEVKNMTTSFFQSPEGIRLKAKVKSIF